MKTDNKINYFNLAYKIVEDEYGTLASNYGISDCTLWILYTLYTYTDENLTQTDIAHILHLNKYSVSSAIKKLEKDEYVVLEKTTENQKNKILRLTEKGKILAENTAGKIITTEQQILECFSTKEHEMFKRLLDKYVKTLKECFNQLKQK